MGTMKQSCQQYGLASDSDAEIDDIRTSIEQTSADTGLDATFIAGVMMQESKGCTRVPTSRWSHANPGLFQSHDGTGSCNDRPLGPCPRSEILQMVKDGVEGTSQGDGLIQCLKKAKGDGSTGSKQDEATYYYRAARLYNSGSPSPDGDLARNGATKCYCSDIANRLIGWSDGKSSGCTAQSVI